MDLFGESVALSYRDTMYNNGVALSQAALSASLQDGRNLVRVEELNLTAEESVALLFPYWWWPESLHLLFIEREGRKPRIFRAAGAITFKGFEGMAATRVWELIPATRPVYARLIEAMGRMQDQDSTALSESLLAAEQL